MTTYRAPNPASADRHAGSRRWRGQQASQSCSRSTNRGNIPCQSVPRQQPIDHSPTASRTGTSSGLPVRNVRLDPQQRSLGRDQPFAEHDHSIGLPARKGILIDLVQCRGVRGCPRRRWSTGDRPDRPSGEAIKGPDFTLTGGHKSRELRPIAPFEPVGRSERLIIISTFKTRRRSLDQTGGHPMNTPTLARAMSFWAIDQGGGLACRLQSRPHRRRLRSQRIRQDDPERHAGKCSTGRKRLVAGSSTGHATQDHLRCPHRPGGR